jgi:hypothetical protein
MMSVSFGRAMVLLAHLELSRKHTCETSSAATKIDDSVMTWELL